MGADPERSVFQEEEADEGNNSGAFLLYILLPAIYALFHTITIIVGLSPVLRGELIDPDGYVHLLVATELHETGIWYDQVLERSNAPYGEKLHTTRPLDVLLLIGAWTLMPFLGFRDALFWSGALISPVLHIVLAVVVAWATRPFLSRVSRVFLMLLLLFQLALVSYALAGRADHHLLILVVFAASLGLTARLLRRPTDGRRLAVAAGAATGFGLWLSVEFLLPLVVAFAATTVVWVRDGGDLARKNTWYAAGLAATIAVALVAERPFADLFSVEYDRVAVVHLMVALIAVGFWLAVRWVAARRSQPLDHTTGRLAAAAMGGAAAVALLWLSFPQFFAGPLASLDPLLKPIFLDRVSELQSLLPTDRLSLGLFIVHFGTSLIAVPYVLWRLAEEYRGSRWPFWVFLCIGFAVFLPAALKHGRFAPYVEILGAVALVDLVFGLVLPRLSRLRPASIRTLSRVGAAGGLLYGFYLFGAALTLSAAPGAGPQAALLGCPLQKMAGYLNDPKTYGDRPRTILSAVNYASELLYRTNHRTVASASHRNSAGIIDSYRAMIATGDRDSLAIVRERGIDLILLCPSAGEAVFFTPPGDMGSTLYRRLLDGEIPGWLRPVDLPPEMADAFRLYEVVDGRAFQLGAQ